MGCFYSEEITKSPR